VSKFFNRGDDLERKAALAVEPLGDVGDLCLGELPDGVPE